MGAGTFTVTHIYLVLRFSTFREQERPLEGWGSPQGTGSVGVWDGGGGRLPISNKLPGDTDAAGLRGLPFENLLSRDISSVHGLRES
jgi:hypothetical protein